MTQQAIHMEDKGCNGITKLILSEHENTQQDNIKSF